MLETLLNIDRQIFEFVNSISYPLLDAILVGFRSKATWIPLYIAILVYTLAKFKKQSLIIIGAMIITVLLADQISASIIKPLFDRARPCQIGNAVKILVHCGSGKSFVSSHATNHFALATYWVLIFNWSKSFSVMAFLWATIIAFAQVYVGVHYPLDVISGALLGILIGWFMAKLCKLSLKHLNAEI